MKGLPLLSALSALLLAGAFSVAGAWMVASGAAADGTDVSASADFDDVGTECVFGSGHRSTIAGR